MSCLSCNLRIGHDLQVKPPRVAESAVHLECVLRHEYPIHDRYIGLPSYELRCYTARSLVNALLVASLRLNMCREGKIHSTILVAEVVMLHANEGVLEKDEKGRPCVKLEKLAPISKVGYLDYGLTTATVEMEMPNHTRP